jgi:hypothetical protein
MTISQAGTINGLFGRAGRLLSLPILAGAMLATIGAQPALAQRDEQRFGNEQRSEEHRDERRTPPGHRKQQDRDYSYGYYETPRYVYAPPPVVYAPPSALEFVFPLNFR